MRRTGITLIATFSFLIAAPALAAKPVLFNIKGASGKIVSCTLGKVAINATLFVKNTTPFTEFFDLRVSVFQNGIQVGQGGAPVTLVSGISGYADAVIFTNHLDRKKSFSCLVTTVYALQQ